MTATLPDLLAGLTGPGGPFEIVTEDVRGVKMQVYAKRMRNVAELLTAAEGNGAKVALVQEGRSLTFEDVLGRVRSLAAAFAAEGIGRGDRVAILAANSPELGCDILGDRRAGGRERRRAVDQGTPTAHCGRLSLAHGWRPCNGLRTHRIGRRSHSEFGGGVPPVSRELRHAGPDRRDLDMRPVGCRGSGR